MVVESKKYDDYERVALGLTHAGYAIIDSFLSLEESRQLRAFSAAHFSGGAFRKAGVGRRDNYQLDGLVRGDFIRWIDRAALDPAYHFFLDRIDELVRHLNRSCYLGIRDQELHFAVYPPGAGYQRHLDVFRGTAARKVSVVCYLNEDWQEGDGGQLRLFLPDGDGETVKDIFPLAGRLACFLSETIEHAVLPASRERYSITGWLKDQ